MKKSPWRAEEGFEYFYVTSGGRVCEHVDSRSEEDDDRYSFGNYFDSMAAADQIICQFSFILKEYHENTKE